MTWVVKYFTRESFIEFLERTLIPDLLESEKIYTAEDFLRAICFMKDPKLEKIDDISISIMIKKYRRDLNE